MDRLEFGSINCIPELPDLSQVMNELSAIRISSISVSFEFLRYILGSVNFIVFFVNLSGEHLH